MEMTIEDAKEYGNMWIDMNQDAKETNTFQFFSMAIDIMRKYQKIEQIINDNANGAYFNIAEVRRIINNDSTDMREVLENGNDN